MPVINENKYNGHSPQTLVDYLKSEKITLNDLEPKNNNHIQAALDYFRDNRSRVAEFKTEIEYQFLCELIKKDYTFFAYLDPKQYRDDIAQLFIIELLKDPKFEKDSEPLIRTYLSYDKKIVIPYDYQTQKGDEIYYFDSELQVPASLVSSFKSTVKIENPVEFIKMLDVDVKSLQPAIILNKLYYIFNTSFRKVLFDTVGKEGVGYYKATNSIVEIEKRTIAEINEKFDKKCAVASSLAINKIEVDREVRDKIENEFFELRKKRINIDEELKYQKDSMELFAKKLELLNKYSAPKDMLTEAEKDKAFDRYAKKGVLATPSNLPASQLTEKVDEEIEDGIELEADKITTIKKRWYFYVRLFGGILTALMVTIFAFVPMGHIGLNLIVVGSFLLVYGVLLIVTGVIQKKTGNRVLEVKSYDEIE